jgi:hypothetical protein
MPPSLPPVGCPRSPLLLAVRLRLRPFGGPTQQDTDLLPMRRMRLLEHDTRHVLSVLASSIMHRPQAGSSRALEGLLHVHLPQYRTYPANSQDLFVPSRSFRGLNRQPPHLCVPLLSAAHHSGTYRVSLPSTIGRNLQIALLPARHRKTHGQMHRRLARMEAASLVVNVGG